MFNFKKKKVEDYDSSIFENLSINQKMSLLNMLFLIARCDGEIGDNPNEMRFLNSYHTLFKINLKDSQEYMNLGGINRLISDLNPLTRKQKEYLLTTTFDLIRCDGNSNDTEISTMLNIFVKIGISEDECFEIIQKVMLFAKL